MQFVWYCQLAGQKALVTEVECCHCHQTVGVTEAYTTVPVDSRGVPSGGYLHCGTCMLHGDPKLAWQVAHADDVRRTGENSAPVADGLTSVTP